MCPKVALKKYLFEIWILPGHFAYWADVEITLTFHLRPVVLDDSIKFCNLLWCFLAPGGIDNEGFDYASLGLLPFYLAI